MAHYSLVARRRSRHKRKNKRQAKLPCLGANEAYQRSPRQAPICREKRRLPVPIAAGTLPHRCAHTTLRAVLYPLFGIVKSFPEGAHRKCECRHQPLATAEIRSTASGGLVSRSGRRPPPGDAVRLAIFR